MGSNWKTRVAVVVRRVADAVDAAKLGPAIVTRLSSKRVMLFIQFSLWDWVPQLKDECVLGLLVGLVLV